MRALDVCIRLFEIVAFRYLRLSWDGPLPRARCDDLDRMAGYLGLYRRPWEPDYRLRARIEGLLIGGAR